MTAWDNKCCTDKELKKSVHSRLLNAKKDGVTAGEIENVGDDFITIHAVYDMMEAKKFPTEMWQKMDEALKILGY